MTEPGGSEISRDDLTDGSIAETDAGAVAFFRALVEHSSEGILATDESSRIVFANPAVESIFGYPPGELVGESLTMLVPDRFVDRHLRGMERFCETGERRLDWDGVKLPGAHRAGHEVPLLVSFRELRLDDRRLFAGIVRDISDWERRERELAQAEERYRLLIEAAPDAIFVADAETGLLVDANAAAEKLLGKPHEELVGMHQSELHPAEEIERYRGIFADHAATGGIRVYEDLTVVDAGGRRIPIEINAAVTEVGERRLVLGIFRDVTERRRYEHRLERQRDELERLNRINRLVRQVHRGLVEASTRRDVEQLVCDRMVSAEPYLFAWVGRVDAARQSIVPTASAGLDEGYLDEITITVDGQETAGGPAGRAIRTHEVCVVQEIDADPHFSPWRESALARGFHSSAAVPLSYDGRLYGILNLYSSRPGAFDERERALLGELGDAVGHALAAIDRKQALMSDSCIELELRARDVVPELVEGRDSYEFSVERTVPGGDDSFLQYVRVSGLSAESVRRLVSQLSSVARARLVSRHGDEALYEVRLSEPALTSRIAAHGGRVTSIAVDGSDIRLVAEFPYETDVRRVVEAITADAPDVEAVGQRTVPRGGKTAGTLRTTVEDRLTDKQRAALEAAYFAGYFGHTRESTGNEIAESLGVTPSTFHQHLQVGLEKVLSSLFESG